jgi:hypothetical protein
MAKPSFVPNHYFLANLVYAANGECIDTVICDGKIIMENQQIPGQEVIYRKVQEVADRDVDYKKEEKEMKTDLYQKSADFILERIRKTTVGIILCSGLENWPTHKRPGSDTL